MSGDAIPGLLMIHGARRQALAGVAAALLAASTVMPAAATADASVAAGHAGHYNPTPAPTPVPAAVVAATAASAPQIAATAPMDHGPMQGGAAPADARDPHAYSGGYALGTGLYALGETRQLHLADEHNFATLLFDRLERVDGRDGDAGAYEAQARIGRTYDHLVVKAEGEVAGGKLHEARTELLWGHAVAPFWDAQLGLRHDGGVGRDRAWLAAGVQGLAPYWFEVDITAYVGDRGRTALRLEAEYEWLLTQKLVVQPRIEANLYGKRDPERNLGQGLADLTAGVRLRYEFTRQFAPYVGVERAGLYGQTADLARAGGQRTRDTRWVAGLRLWF